MTVRSEPMKDGQPVERRRPLNASRMAAIGAWLIGAFTTWLFANKAMGGSAWLLAAVLALGAQGLLTLAERPLFRLLWGRGGRFTLLAVLSVIIDALLNAAGLYPYIGRIADTDLGAMLVEVFNVRPAVEPISAFAIALVLGTVLAGMPEGLWES